MLTRPPLGLDACVRWDIGTGLDDLKVGTLGKVGVSLAGLAPTIEVVELPAGLLVQQGVVAGEGWAGPVEALKRSDRDALRGWLVVGDTPPWTTTTAGSVTPASVACRMAWMSAWAGRWRWASSTSISARVPWASPCLRRQAVQNASWWA